MIEQIEALPRVKKVFIRSGIRFDYLMYDKDDSFFRKMVRDNVSGQLKVAPEHCCDSVLRYMGKPSIGVYNAFKEKYFSINRELGKEQYLVPYLMSSHPGSTLDDAVELALYLKRGGYSPEQVQDFYPTPGTASTVMYYTGIDPITGKKVFTETDYHEKQLQRALLQWSRPENAAFVREALKKCGREDLIGYSSDCLIKPERGAFAPRGSGTEKRVGGGNGKAAGGASRRGNAPEGAVKNGRKARTGGSTPKNSQNNVYGISSRKNSGEVGAKPKGSGLKRKEGWAKPKPKKGR